MIAPRPRQAFTRICAYCGAAFAAESDRARYCSPGHKQKAYRERQARKAKTI